MNENLKSRESRGEIARQRVETLETCLNELARLYQHEWMSGEMRIYLLALLPVPLVRLKAALVEGLRVWKFFPRPAEIFELTEIVQPEQQRIAAEQASERLAAQYKAARQNGYRPKLLASVLDPATPEQLGQLSRERKLALGLEQPGPIDPERVALLKAQARELMRRPT